MPCSSTADAVLAEDATKTRPKYEAPGVWYAPRPCSCCPNCGGYKPAWFPWGRDYPYPPVYC